MTSTQGLRIIVCGGRDFDDYTTVRRALFALHEGPRGPVKCVFHGNARGADSEADRWCREFRISAFPCPAEWAKYGRRAGPIRNQNMLGNKVDLVLAFPGGAGTADMKKRARKAGVEVIEITENWLGEPIRYGA